MYFSPAVRQNPRRRRKGLSVPPDLGYVATIVGLFILPRLLQRFRIPSAITCMGLGIAMGMGFGLFRDDHTVKTLSTLGIVAMFLFAGLEMDLKELGSARRIIAQHIAIQVLLSGLALLVLTGLFDTGPRQAILVGLALFSPSTGFILDSLASLHLDRAEQFWVKTKAISTELVALLALLLVVQSTSIERLLLTAAALTAMVLILPFLFKAFISVILPFAPRTEFAFLLCAALVCASITHRLGVYYLVGAFVVGLVAQRFGRLLPSVTSGRMIHAIEVFAYFFIPFYFFRVGVDMNAANFSPAALLTGAVLLAAAIPIRLGFVGAHRRIVLGESLNTSLRIGIPMLPTLVFTIVISEILRDRFGAAPELIGGLVIYAIVNTTLPGLLMRIQPPEYESHPGSRD
jgi:Kef-type K+ transport system membrane component KefB